MKWDGKTDKVEYTFMGEKRYCHKSMLEACQEIADLIEILIGHKKDYEYERMRQHKKMS